ncbi:NADH dehydrogenase [ubiquinone] 1 beta subcomplex subunit NP15.6 [Calliopsis andreniformis]|uniref:NADH dehydrogenase [ubiquinone] 1 beta subcomplex subunit NP15.6 n=1 Tax=Calliopsis andreniformis TaxID=337506 RepID=UPI003FCC7C7C
MSTLIRLVRPQGIRNGLTSLASKGLRVCRNVSSTPKTNEASSEQSYPVKRTWISYGFDEEDEKKDRHMMHQTFFVGVSICLIGGMFVLAYLPDPALKDWAQREAFLQIRYKEEHGLPYIDPNLIDPSKIILPSDEELGDTEIII